MRLSVIAVCAALAGMCAGLVACEPSILKTGTDAPRLDARRLDQEVAAIADRARPGVLGVALMNLQSGEFWTFNGDRAFPLGAAVGAPLGAAALSEVDAGRLRLDETLPIGGEDLSPPPSPMADAWPARRAYTVRELLTAAMGGSDNTATDVLMKRIGGPGAVTGWLRLKNIDQVRVDRYEREIQPDIAGMASFRQGWKGEPAFTRAMTTVPPTVRRGATEAYLRDPRDTATPRGYLQFLMGLNEGTLLSEPSTALMLQVMANRGAAEPRLKAGLPAGVGLSHGGGSGRTDLGRAPVTNEVAILTLPDKRRYAVAVFLAGSTLGGGERDAVIAEVGRAVTRGVR